MKTKVAIMEGIKNIVIKEIELPSLKPDEVLVKIHQCNICTTDWQTWAGLRKSQGREFPWAPGHEIAGEIVAKGDKVKNFEVGMHVGISTIGAIGCGQCKYCRKGYTTRCIDKPEPMEINGIKGSFGYSQYIVHKEDRIFELDKDLPFEEGAYLEPVAASVHAVLKLNITPGDKILIIGAGNLGLVNAQVARAFGGEVYVSEINEERCRLSSELGFITLNSTKEDIISRIKELTNDLGVDGVIISAGNNEANKQALNAIAPMGKVIFFAAGYPAPILQLDSNAIHYKEFELIGAYGSNPTDYEIAAWLLNTGKVKVDKLISYKVPLSEIQKGFELATVPGNYRVSISMW